MPRSVVDIEQDPSTVTHTQPTRAELDPQRAVQHVKSPEEKRYLRKLDICLMTYACCSQIMKYLDQQAINFAWTSGLQTDLNLHGNELNYFLTYFNIGYCIFLIPSQVMITWFRPCIWLSTLELVWGGLTMALAATHNAKQIYVIRVFIGIAESSAYPGAVTLLTSWYTPTEMIKRIGLYHSSQAMGALLAGALQAAILKTLDGKAGLAGWRWTFIIDGLITLGIALIGYFMIPDFPDRPNRLTPYLNANDKAIAEDRLARWKRKTPKAVNWPTFVRLAKNPMTYGFIWLYAGLLLANYGYNYLNLFLQSLTNPDGSKVWTREALAAIPIGGYAIQIASVWFFAFLSDFFRTRWTLILAMALIGGVSTLILTIWHVSLGAKYYAYFAMFVANSQGPVLWSWMSDMLPQDADQRTLMVGACITTYYAFNAWANVLIYPASKAPRYTVGWPVCFGIFCSCILVVIAFRLYDVKVVRPRNYRAAKEEERVQLEAQAEALAREGGDKKDKDEVSMAVLQEVRSL